MRAIIVGGGEVGFHLAQRLSMESQDVALVEANPERAQYASEQLDIQTIVGNGASLSVLKRAGVEQARMLIAATSQDEVNLISCLAASRIGVEYTVARISNPDYYVEGNVLSREQLGVDLMINPERECAAEAYQILQSPAATEVAYFAKGRVQMIGLEVQEGAQVAGKSLAELGREFTDYHYVTAAILRVGETIIPTGESRIEAGDRIYLLAPVAEIPTIPSLAGYDPVRLRRVMIAGGSREGQYLAEILERHRVACTILDSNRRRCLELAEALPHSLVLHGDATDLELLEMEGVAGIDGFVSATGNDQTNLLSSLVAKSVGARRVVSLIQNFDYLPLVQKVGVDAAVSTRRSTVNAILRYIRRGPVVSVAALKEVDAEVIEFEVVEGAPITHHPLRETDFPRGGIVGTIVRGEDVIIPRGDDHVRAGDEVIVFARREAIAEIEKLFA
jgi:trk system potassium uptake protein